MTLIGAQVTYLHHFGGRLKSNQPVYPEASAVNPRAPAWVRRLTAGGVPNRGVGSGPMAVARRPGDGLAVSMDAIGARHLRRAIEQQEQWRQADAVRVGHQPLRDPDVSQLQEFDGVVRRYRSSDGRSFEKRLRDGLWHRAAAEPDTK